MKYLYNDSNTIKKRRNLRKNQTDAERKLWFILRGKRMNGLKFFRQYNIDKYILDFYCPKYRIAIEVDGGQHNEDVHKQHDENRTSYLNKNNIQVLRFWNNEVMNNIEGVWQTINKFIKRS